ncbi:MAG TPA: uracil-DNA glycosylase family protein [Gemmatimonadaceae bacterium]|nr:uracil-DNA glycosylase family protein [Gemmatimonadaceae bacterium]
MDAREQLRRYLEQRREMGETELVLDALTVDEALRILGAPAGTPSTAPSSMPSATRSGATSGAKETSTRSAPPPPTDDWRAALRAAGVAPPADDVERGVAKSTESRPSKQIAADADEQPVESSAVAPGISAGAGAAGQLGGSMTSLDTLNAIAKHVASCTRCPLYSTATNPVPGEGNPNADFMCVGEAPGATEDETGRPFIGAAGQLLTKILGAIDLKREDVFICNVLKHRPPGNRNPRPEEVIACSPYLLRQIELIQPKVILALGTFAAQTLLDTKLSIGKLRGQVHRYYGVPLIVTYHPAALLRNPGWKRPTWEDVQLARRILDSAPPASPG